MYKYKDKIQINTLPVGFISTNDYYAKQVKIDDYYIIDLNDYIPNFMSIKDIYFNVELYSNKGIMSYSNCRDLCGNGNHVLTGSDIDYKLNPNIPNKKNLVYLLKMYADKFKTIKLNITPGYIDIYKYFYNCDKITIKGKEIEVKNTNGISFLVNLDHNCILRSDTIKSIDLWDIYIDYNGIQKGSYEYSLIAFLCISFAWKMYNSLKDNTGYNRLLKS